MREFRVTRVWDIRAENANDALKRAEEEGELIEEEADELEEREPPEMDGEAFRGGEAAAWECEQQERARRLK